MNSVTRFTPPPPNPDTAWPITTADRCPDRLETCDNYDCQHTWLPGSPYYTGEAETVEQLELQTIDTIEETILRKQHP
jgi:hypothetical protein